MNNNKNNVMGAGIDSTVNPPVTSQVTPPIKPQATIGQTMENTKIIPANEPTSLQNARRHGTLGEYKRVTVYPTIHAQQNTSIFASIGLYSVDITPGSEIELPQAIIDLLDKASTIEHYYDPNATSENGNRGAHLSRDVPKYIVK